MRTTVYLNKSEIVELIVEGLAARGYVVDGDVQLVCTLAQPNGTHNPEPSVDASVDVKIGPLPSAIARHGAK